MGPNEQNIRIFFAQSEDAFAETLKSFIKMTVKLGYQSYFSILFWIILELELESVKHH